MNRTSVMILQHRRERFHRFNTARIVRQSLDRCQLIVEHNVDLASRFDEISLSENVGLLYPGNDAQLLTELGPSDCPDQIVVLDGTWHHAKTLMRDIPRLRTLPRFRLAPSSPGRYRIRREPNEHALSTLEATVAALTAIEPETLGLDQLLNVFERMIDNQLNHTPANWRQNQRRRRGSTNVPRALTGDLGNIVVAYGEQERGDKHDRKGIRPAPVFWTAKRLESGETFQSTIHSPCLQDNQFLQRLGLTSDEVSSSVSLAAFRENWKAFLRPNDQLAVYHQSTARLLENVDAKFRKTVILKSIHGEQRFGTLDEFLQREEIDVPSGGRSRAAQRLANAIAYVQYLNSRYSANVITS